MKHKWRFVIGKIKQYVLNIGATIYYDGYNSYNNCQLLTIKVQIMNKTKTFWEKYTRFEENVFVGTSAPQYYVWKN